MAKKIIVSSLAILALAGSLFLLLHKSQNKAGRLVTNASEALGQRVAEEVAQLLGNRGQIVVLRPEVPPDEQNSPPAVEMKLFEQTLKQRGIKIAVSKTLSREQMNLLAFMQRFPGRDYGELQAQASGAGAIVSFVGPPDLSVADLKKLAAQGPPLVVVRDVGARPGSDLAALVEARAVALGFVPKTAAEREQGKTQSKIFDRYYKILRAE